MITDLSTVWFENPRDGQRFRIISLPNGQHPGRFVLEYIYRPMTGATAVPAHFHPSSTEEFEILAGQAKYRIGGITSSARAGERIVMPAGVVHLHPWSDGPDPLQVRQTAETIPADPAGILASLQALITLTGLASAGKVNRAGLPSLLQLAVLIRSTMPATFLDRPPVPVQRALFRMLGALGVLVGYRTAYPRYGIVHPGGLEVATGAEVS
jgi:mannose-6-phosphate isomerase-like protein (cupin superfamily)